jgi:hypothetical protein
VNEPLTFERLTALTATWKFTNETPCEILRQVKALKESPMHPVVKSALEQIEQAVIEEVFNGRREMLTWANGNEFDQLARRKSKAESEKKKGQFSLL